jgi:DNA-binding transcriptional regulator YiaG
MPYQLAMIAGMTAKRMLLLKVAVDRSKNGTGRQIREQAQVPMRLVAEHIGVTEATVSRWETGDRRPRGEPAIRWVELLDEMRRELAKAVR